MSGTKASEILASALRDMDEILKVSENNIYREGSISNDCGVAKINTVKNLPVSSSLKQWEVMQNDDSHSFELSMDRRFNSRREVSALINDLRGCIQNLNTTRTLFRESPGNIGFDRQHIVSSIQEHANDRNSHMESFRPVSPAQNCQNSKSLWLVNPKNAGSNSDEERRVLVQITELRNQIQMQAKRIAELEQERQQSLRFCNVPWTSNNSGDKMDLLTEVSKQHLRISSLEQTNRDLEEKIMKLENELSHRPTLFSSDWYTPYEDLTTLKSISDPLGPQLYEINNFDNLEPRNYDKQSAQSNSKSSNSNKMPKLLNERPFYWLSRNRTGSSTGSGKSSTDLLSINKYRQSPQLRSLERSESLKLTDKSHTNEPFNSPRSNRSRQSMIILSPSTEELGSYSQFKYSDKKSVYNQPTSFDDTGLNNKNWSDYSSKPDAVNTSNASSMTSTLTNPQPNADNL